MDELTPNVGAGAEGAGSSASQPNESTSQQAAIEGDAAKLLQLLEGKLTERFSTLEKNFTSQLDGLRKVQGDIDRSRNEFKERLQELNRLTKSGMSQDEAIEVLDKRAAEQDRFTKLEKQIADLTSLLAGNQQGRVQQSVATVFEQYGLDVKDPRVSPSLQKQYANADAMVMEALKLFHSIQTSPNPTASQQPAMTGGTSRRDAKDISQINDSSTLYDLASKDILGG